MTSLVDLLLAVVLFVLLSPGILVRLPPNGSKWTVAIVHGIIFAIVMYFVYLYVLPSLEGFCRKKSDCGGGAVHCTSKNQCKRNR
jgi:hypothetical protein